MPSVRDLWSYGETGFHSLAAAVVRERYPREALVALSYSGRRATGAHEVFDPHRLADGPPRFPTIAGTRACESTMGERLLHLLKHIDGHARLHQRQSQRREQSHFDGIRPSRS